MGASLLPVQVALLIAQFEFKIAVLIKHSRVVPTGSPQKQSQPLLATNPRMPECMIAYTLMT